MKITGLLKKIGIISIAGVLSMGMLAGCGGTDSDKNVSFDVPAMADYLKEKVTFVDQLGEIDKDMALELYELPAEQVADMKVYMGSGGTAEEIAVFQAKDDPAPVKQAVKNRIESKKVDFVDYVPAEMAKLEDPVVVTKGNYVILCLSDHNDEAKKAIDEFMKK